MCEAIQQIVDYIKDKKILILGFGREGKSTLAFIRRYIPDMPVTVADKAQIELTDSLTATVCGDNYLDCINGFSLVFKSPGIPFIGLNISPDTEITCQLDMFLRFPPFDIIGVTGTKGKTTTTTLIYKMLCAGGKKAALIGNIGIPVFEVLDGRELDIAAVEMSSHQLEFTKASPRVAVLVNIYEEHLDHYETGFDGYVNSKLNILRYQNSDGYFIYDPEQHDSRVPDIEPLIKGTAAPVPHSEVLKNEFFRELQQSTGHLLGEHNLQNIAYAVTAARTVGVSDSAIKTAIASFEGIEHRMELVGTYNGIIFYNDSIATPPEAVISALKALKTVDTLIFGGLDRGIDYSAFVAYLTENPVANLIGMPETGFTIVDMLEAAGCKSKMLKAQTMHEAVEAAYEYTQKGKICLLSPAAASYNRYKNFEEKGRAYKDEIKNSVYASDS